MIYASALKKSFKNNIAVEIDSLRINKGELLGIVGNNGAGKTTFFRLLLNLLKADEGKIEIDHTEITQTDDWKSFTGAYLDDHFLIPFLTPQEYWEFILRMKGRQDLNIDDCLSNYDGLLTKDINSKKYIRELSAGNKARVGIIGALIGDPDLIILDEPFANMDPSSQNFLVKLIKEKPESQTVLVSSHDLTHIKNISDRVLLMEEGKIIMNVDNKSAQEAEKVMSYFK